MCVRYVTKEIMTTNRPSVSSITHKAEMLYCNLDEIVWQFPTFNRSDGQVDRASASEAADAGSIPVLGQAVDVRKLAFIASLLGVHR